MAFYEELCRTVRTGARALAVMAAYIGGLYVVSRYEEDREFRDRVDGVADTAVDAAGRAAEAVRGAAGRAAGVFGSGGDQAGRGRT